MKRKGLVWSACCLVVIACATSMSTATPRVIEVVVLDADSGAPLANVPIAARPPGQDRLQVFTDSTGVATFHIRGGKARIQLTRTGYVSNVLDVVVNTEKTYATIEAFLPEVDPWELPPGQCSHIGNDQESYFAGGVVRVRGSMLPIESAQVYAGQCGTLTDPQGRFRLNLPLVHADSLHVDFIGHTRRTVALHATKAGELYRIDVALEPYPYNLDHGDWVRPRRDTLSAARSSRPAVPPDDRYQPTAWEYRELGRSHDRSS